jgi:hypothetical protein
VTLLEVFAPIGAPALLLGLVFVMIRFFDWQDKRFGS